MAEHTPGPLSIVEAKTIDQSGQWHIYLAAPDGRKIAALWGSQDEKMGNATLFGAAPELLAALQKLTNESYGAWSAYEAGLRELMGHTNYNVLAERITQAEAAIAKATGDQPR